MKEFDLYNAPLFGSNLVEAAAGSGKTHIITRLFLRLILERGLSVKEILVLTFTEAATAELRTRIRGLLRDALKLLQGQPSDAEPSLVDYIAKNYTARAFNLLTDAIRSIDEAAVFTIHGFCQKTLLDNAFESGYSFDAELVTDQDPLIEEVVEDFWRERVAGAAPEFVRYAMGKNFYPQPLKKYIGNRIDFKDLKIIPETDPPNISSTAFGNAFEKTKAAWPKVRAEAEKIFMDAGFKRTIYKFKDMPGLIKNMDIFLASKGDDPSLFKGFDKFTPGKMAVSMKKGRAAPDLPFFRLCGSLMEEAGLLCRDLDRMLLYLKVELFRYAGREMEQRKRRENIRSFSDLLVQLREPLKDERKKTALARVIRSRYKAALIDEFQDTDPVQWGILRELFYSREGGLFLIGDPKQAIYGFRGADLHAYLDAAEKIESRATLRENHRSESGLVKAVNTLFSRTGNPFAHEGIRYHMARSAGEADKEPLAIDGEKEPPFKLWFLGRGREKDPAASMSRERARERIANSVAFEVARLVTRGRAGKAMLGVRPLAPSDLAILVRTHKEARLMRSTLSSLRITSTLDSMGFIFDSDEAEEVQRVLAALADPCNMVKLRSALATDIIGCNGERLEELETSVEELDSILLRFRHYHKVWEDVGFIRMFREFVAREGVKKRLLSLPRGERRVTNLLHILEVLHARSVERGLGVDGLRAWLDQQRDPDSPSREKENELRLESDEHAVRVVTMHKSKGLQYPIVFAPFMWGDSKIKEKDEFYFHDNTGRLTLAVGPDERQSNRQFAERELLAENLRLLYVALTRAKNRCVSVWGRIKGGETSALAYLLHNRNAPETFLKQAASTIGKMTDSAMLDDLNQLIDSAAGSIELQMMPEGEADLIDPPQRKDVTPVCRVFTGRVKEAWNLSSFSSMTHARPTLSDEPDRDPWYGGDDETMIKGGAYTIFSFHRGSRTGNLLHSIFEEADFAAREHNQLVEKWLDQYGYGQEEISLWSGPLCSMIRRVLTAPLEPGANDFTLSRVPQRNRVHEMEFCFSTASVTPEELGQIFARHSKGGLGSFPERVSRLAFSSIKGFMKGFIDLIFEHGSRYYLLDWKSNHLGNSVDDYNPGTLEDVMERELYTLQYHIYSVALDRYLKVRIPGYNYDSHFGGVFYIFLRGVDRGKGPEYGIYRDRPSMELVEELGSGFVGVG